MLYNGAKYLADDIFKFIFFYDNNNPALAHIMAWRRIGDKPLFGPMTAYFSDAYIYALYIC